MNSALPLALLTAPALLLAQAEPAAVAGPKAGYTLVNPVPETLMRPLSTDRPDTTESPYSVDAGHFQIESSFVDFNRDRSGGVTTETWILGQTNLKVGLLDRTDLQIIINPAVNEKTSGGGASSTANGIGDTVVRLKQNLWGNEGDTTTAFAIMPWISTRSGSRELRAERHEGGLIAPLSIAVADGVSTGLMLQADLLWDDSRSRHYVDWTHSNTWSFSITDSLGVFVEYVGRHSSGTESNYRAIGDLGITYAVHANLVLDTGIRVGLNSRADDFGAFTGISYRH